MYFYESHLWKKRKVGKCDFLDKVANKLQTVNAKLMKENYRVKPWVVLYKFAYFEVLIIYSPKLTIEPLPRMMAGGRGGGAGRSKLSDNGRTIFKLKYDIWRR